MTMIPIRTVLIVGTEEAGVRNLTIALTANRQLIFPCLHRVKIDSDEGIVQADLKIYHRTDLKVPSPGEEKPDVILVVYDSANKNSSAVLGNEWAEELSGMEQPKILVATGMEKGIKYLVDDHEKKDPLLNIHATYTTALSVGASAVFEISLRQVHKVREVFVQALRASIDPEGSKTPITEDAIVEARTELFEALKDEGIGVPVSGQPVKKSNNPKIKQMLSTEAANEKPKWQVKKHPGSNKTYYINVVTREKSWDKPANFDGDLTQEQKEKRAEKKFEKEVDKLRQRHYAVASNARIDNMEKLTKEEEDNFEKLMISLSRERDALSEQVEGLREELSEIKEIERKNDVRSDRIQDLSDLRSRKDTIIQERVQEDVTHERQMEALNDQLDALTNADRCKAIPQETFNTVRLENRRLTQQLGTIFEEAKATRLAIKKIETAAKNLKAKTDSEEMRCMQGEAKIQTVRNEVVSVKESISKLKAKKEWLTNELILQRGTEANVAQQLKEWKREVKMLMNMLTDIDDKIAQQEVPISKYMIEERRKARVRGGPLILDDEDRQLLKSKQSLNGEYKAPTNKQLMVSLRTEHDRMSLQYQYSCIDIATASNMADEHLQQIRTDNEKYIVAEQINSHLLQDVTKNLHSLLLLLRDISEARGRALLRLQNKKDRYCEKLCNIQSELDTYLSYSMNPTALVDSDSADPTSQINIVSQNLQEKIYVTRMKLYATTEKVETIATLHREQAKALKAIIVQKDSVENRIRECDTEAGEAEQTTRQLVTDALSLINSVEQMPLGSVPKRGTGEMGRYFLAKSLTGLHHRTKDVIVKRCSNKSTVAAAPSSSSISNITNTLHSTSSNRLLSTKKSTSSTKQKQNQKLRAPTVSSSKAEDRYGDLVSSLKKEFGMENKLSKTDKREGAWRKTW
eukprot:TRINITY_DN1358_c5_g1_i1.p1 TRINITY_DN1358_c5_g1~~TRINITY_DN1358_c5_g1_i1.p1  ORF type:complete len:917 (+),score=204.73 TRINITY_DN1358_c5_g1_i1:102-2852(+)